MEDVQSHFDRGVLTLTLNRPQTLNALNSELLDTLEKQLKRATDSTVRAVVLTGAGRGFSSGQDLGELEGKKLDFQVHLSRYNRVVRRLSMLDKPVLASINGVAAGAGMSLALASDLRIAGTSAYFVTAFIRIGLVPDSGMSYTLPRLVGAGKAMELLMFSPKVSAAEAHAIGLINRVVSDQELASKTQTLARQLAAGPTRAYGLLKQALRKSSSTNLDEMLDYEAILQGIAGETEDHQQALQAFLEKCAPSFRGY